MRKMLGTRCPECGTTDAPCVLRSGTARTDEQYVLLGCVRCGRVAEGHKWENATGLMFREALPLALRAFYGEGQEGRGPLPLPTMAPTLVTGGHGTANVPYSYKYEISTPTFSLSSGWWPTEAEARAAWNKLVGTQAGEE